MPDRPLLDLLIEEKKLHDMLKVLHNEMSFIYEEYGLYYDEQLIRNQTLNDRLRHVRSEIQYYLKVSR